LCTPLPRLVDDSGAPVCAAIEISGPVESSRNVHTGEQVVQAAVVGEVGAVLRELGSSTLGQKERGTGLRFYSPKAEC
jgi:hypothetical protein